MAEHSTIEWTDATWNPITGCTVCSPGCANCYAMKLAGTRLKNHPTRIGLTKPSKAGPVWTGEVRFNEKALIEPLKWKRHRMIFVCAHGDLFHESVPDAWIDKVFAVMALCPQHTFQVLTKRSARMRAYFTDDAAWRNRQTVIARNGLAGVKVYFGPMPTITPLPNVWLGVSAERQQEADARIPDLLATPAAVRFVSLEPLLGQIDMKRWLPTGRKARLGDREWIEPRFFMTSCEHCGWVGSSELCRVVNYGDDADVACPSCEEIILADETGRLHWVIVGGESQAGARPMHPDWARAIRDQCTAAGVPFFFKQWGDWEIASHDNGHFDPSMSTNGAKWLHADGLMNGPSCRRTDGASDETAIAMIRVGKKRAGRLLDGVEHNGMPTADVDLSAQREAVPAGAL